MTREVGSIDSGFVKCCRRMTGCFLCVVAGNGEPRAADCVPKPLAAEHEVLLDVDGRQNGLSIGELVNLSGPDEKLWQAEVRVTVNVAVQRQVESGFVVRLRSLVRAFLLVQFLTGAKEA